VKFVLICLFLFSNFKLYSQPSFIEVQKSFPIVTEVLQTKEDTLKSQFAKANLQWPPKELYIRSFKYDSQLEVWARNTSNEQFKLFKSFRICALSGTLGPKRMQGDYQVPEGFYYVNIFNPQSSYHLSLGLNYPNASDNLLSDSLQPGGDIYIHGNCITTGCIPITDHQIEELYLLTALAKSSGQDFIPVHIFPVKYNVIKSASKLQEITKEDRDYFLFSKKMKEVYDFFETNKKLPIISVNKKGEYVIL
jgi:murein L,D-transpeptidase YafK